MHCAEKQELTFSYEQSDLEKAGMRGRIQTTEVARMHFTGPCKVAKSARVNHRLTTTFASSIDQIRTNVDQWHQTEKRTKEAIHGAEGIPPRESGLDPGALVYTCASNETFLSNFQ